MPDHGGEEPGRVGTYFELDAARFDAIYTGRKAGFVQHLVDRAFRARMLRRRYEAVERFARGRVLPGDRSGSGRIAVPWL